MIIYKKGEKIKITKKLSKLCCTALTLIFFSETFFSSMVYATTYTGWYLMPTLTTGKRINSRTHNLTSIYAKPTANNARTFFFRLRYIN
jgi:hypothetical protein